MSTDGDPRDPHGILPGGPDAFCDVWDAETVPEALKKAEMAETTTDYEEFRRCPSCWSVKIHEKITRDTKQRKPGDWKCNECRDHFDKPLPPPARWDFYTTAKDRLETAAEHAHRLNTNPEMRRQIKIMNTFEWVNVDELAEQPRPGFSRLAPDFEHGNRTEAILRAIVLTRPWSDEQGVTNREAAEVVPKGRGFVNYHRHKWQDGEHDELIHELFSDGLEAADTTTDTATATAE